jgi:putative oxidoreductase
VNATKDRSLRRLFSTFARGWPSVGLLLLRLVAGIALIAQVVGKLQGGPSVQVIAFSVLAIALGLLLLVGLWVPVAGTLVAALELCTIPWEHAALATHIFIATIAAALALVGPGFWSVDRRLYGWKRIDPPTRNS